MDGLFETLYIEAINVSRRKNKSMEGKDESEGFQQSAGLKTGADHR